MIKRMVQFLSIVAVSAILAACGGGGNSPDHNGTAPAASAGVDQNVITGSIVTLDGSGSTAPDGELLVYAWAIISKPEESEAVLSNPMAVKPTFIADHDGKYVIALVVKSGSRESAEAFVTITASSANSAPVANSGANQNVTTGSLVTLDGSGSTDADGDQIRYIWSFISKPKDSIAILSDAAAPKPTFTPDLGGDYVVQLVVNDGNNSSAAVNVTISATTANIAPVADAGADRSVAIGTLVTLDGSYSSDADGDHVTYAWRFTSKPPNSFAIISDTGTAKPTFTPDSDGDYVIELVVNDGTDDSTADTVTISVTTANVAPIADAGADREVATGVIVILDGSGSSDADGDQVTYLWSFVSKPDGSSATLSDKAAAKPTFTPNLDGDYVLRLVVNDGTNDSAADTVIISATTANVAPIADAGADRDVATGVIVNLNGSGSSDADGDPITYFWSFVSKPDSSFAILSDSAAVKPTFTPDFDGDYVLRLVVNDGTDDSTADIVTISATTANVAPTADAGADREVATGVIVILDGSGSSDADGDQVTYLWSFVSKPNGSTATLSAKAVVKPTFTPDLDGDYVLRLVVNDGTNDSVADTVTILATTANVAPIADAGADREVATGDIVILDGSSSSDADGDEITYLWSFVSKPNGSTATLSEKAVAKPTFTPDLDGDYLLRLVVNDGTNDSAADAITISATTANVAPTADAGTDRVVATGNPVTLDGSASFDADGDEISYTWSFVSTPAGSTATLSDIAAVNPIFIPDEDGDYVLNLVVNDGIKESQPDTVSVNAATLGLANTVWPTSRGSNRRTGLSTVDTTTNTGKLKWKYDSGLGLLYRLGGSAIGLNGTLYVSGGDSGNFYAINPDGTLKWIYKGPYFGSTPTVGSDGTLYIGSVNGLLAINSNGTTKWLSEGGSTTSDPTIGPDGLIYIGSEYKLNAINIDGTLRWSYSTESYMRSTPAIGSNGTVYVGSEGGVLYAINPDGTLQWSYNTEAGIVTPPAIGSDGTVYVTSGVNVYSITPYGEVNWFVETGSWARSISIGPDGTIYIGSNDGNLYAINKNGSLKWKFTSSYGIQSIPAIGSEGTIYVEMNYEIYGISPGGSLVWSSPEGRGSPIIGKDGTLYFANGRYFLAIQ